MERSQVLYTQEVIYCTPRLSPLQTLEKIAEIVLTIRRLGKLCLIIMILKVEFSKQTTTFAGHSR